MRLFLKGTFSLYAITLVYVFFFLPTRQNVSGGNIVPFQTIRRYKKHYELFKLHVPTAYGIEAQIYGNILIFIPFGFVLPILFRRFRNPLLSIGLVFFLSLLVESIQRVFRIGQFDVDDIILNATGGIIGFVAFVIGDWLLWEYKKTNLSLE
jgi:glycopeptide antibiotics resistance protein